jgi:hypothetical protein
LREANDLPEAYTHELIDIRRRGPRSLDDLTALRGERPMTHSKPVSSSSQMTPRRTYDGSHVALLELLSPIPSPSQQESREQFVVIAATIGGSNNKGPIFIGPKADRAT